MVIQPRLVEAEQPLTEEQRLKLMDLADGQVLIDTTEQQVYRSEDSVTRKAHFLGKIAYIRSLVRGQPVSL